MARGSSQALTREEDSITYTVFHNAEPPWLDERVRSLRPGAKLRLDDARIVSFNGKGWHLWDFREKLGEVYERRMTLEEKLAVMKAGQEADNSAAAHMELPLPGMLHPKDWPVEARAWVFKAGLNNDDVQREGFYWNPKMRRLILPLHMLDGTRAWVGRAVLPDSLGPKYLFPSGMRRGGGAQTYTDNALLTKASEVVIVEDQLSAIRIANDTTRDAVAALGTTLDRDALVHIAKRYSKVHIWLDPDRYGRLGQRALSDRLRAFDVPVHTVSSERDPKLHTAEQIREYLNG